MSETGRIRAEIWRLYEDAEDLDEDVLQARTELLDSLIRLLEVERFVPAPPDSRGRYRPAGSGESESPALGGISGHHPHDGG